MNKEITVYDLLGLIKDGKAPKSIIYKNEYFKYSKENRDYIGENNYLFSDFSDLISILNDKVEILEKDKPIIEKMDLFDDLQDILNSNDESIILNAIHKCLTAQKYKLNEIIDYINRKEDK